jgi:hypothetical protein
MGDVDLIWRLTEAIRKDSEKPSIDQRFNPTDPVAIEIMLHETDYAVEAYMEKWKKVYRDQFADPSLYDNFVHEWQMKCRKDVKAMIAAAQQMIAEEIEQAQEDEDDSDNLHEGYDYE